MSKKKRTPYNSKAQAQARKASASSEKPSKAPQSDEKVTQAEDMVREAKSVSDAPIWLHAAGRDWELIPASKMPAVKIAEVAERMTVRDAETGVTYYEDNPLKMIQDFAWLIGYGCVNPADRAKIALLNTEEFEEILESFLGSEIVDLAN